MTTQPIHFIRRGEPVVLRDVPPTRTLLQVLREDLHCTGTKEGCNEGDCGACTVVLGEAHEGGIRYEAVNSCIRFAHAVNGKALWTVEDIAPTLHRSRGSLPPEGARFVLGRPGDETSAPTLAAENALHPAQQAMVDCFGSQCGFCTPGFVMSLFATYQNRVCRGEAVTRELAQHDLSGNLCRCTGYRPILDAAQRMGELPRVAVDERDLLQKLELLMQYPQGQKANFSTKNAVLTPLAGYFLPKSLRELLQTRARYPQAQVVAGCTDVGLWVNKLHMDFAQVIDVTQVADLRRVERYPHHIAIGAATSLHDAFEALVQDRPQLKAFTHRFAGLPVRNSGTLGGNVVNGSPIGDSMPLLIALRASLVLMRWHSGPGAQGGRAVHRELKVEDFYTGYRKNVLQSDEVLAWIKVPLPAPGEFLRAYKISKRFEDDISAVCLVLNFTLDGDAITAASIGVGGVAATPVRAIKTEAVCANSIRAKGQFDEIKRVLMAEFNPISDMRASSAYRRQVLGNLVERFWLESRGGTGLNLESPELLAETSDGVAP
jgi:xanthine dehydrogenase small subunit